MKRFHNDISVEHEVKRVMSVVVLPRSVVAYPREIKSNSGRSAKPSSFGKE